MSKHTIPQKHWFNYPVLADAQCEQLVYDFGKLIKLKICVGVQDGFYVTGHDVKVYKGTALLWGSSRAACRKWGEYATRSKAILSTLEEIKKACYYHYSKMTTADYQFADSLKKLNDTITAFKGHQLELFNN